MPGKPWTDEEVAALKDGHALGESPEHMIKTRVPGRTVAGVRAKINGLGYSWNVSGDCEPTREATQFRAGEKEANLVVVHREIRTAEDACKHGNVDLGVWEIDRFTVNKWEQASKSDNPEHPVNVVELWQVKVWLKRKLTERDQKSFDYLRDVVSQAKWKPPKRPGKRTGKEDHLLEISLFDAHFGKLCWEQETGSDYDTGIASRYYLNAVDDLLSDNRDTEIERILFPVGQDFFNVDNLRGETTGGTPQDQDSRYHRVFARGFEAVVAAVERCRKIAPVEIVFIEGNHDTLAGFHLAFSLDQLYSESPDVTVDHGPRPRKYICYGVTLLGLTHADKLKHADLPTLMAREASEHWHGCDFYEWHVGHLHTEKKLQQAGSELNGVVIRVLPSLSGSDRWHSQKGFTLNRKAAMSFLYNRENGMRRTSYAYAR